MSEDFLQVKYWFDLMVKAIIGVVVSIVGMDYRSVKNSLKELEQKKYELVMQAEVTHIELVAVKDRLDRIEKKLDRALEK
jgi:tetrahydromethanopterin S-methyltransferase subunit G